MDRDRRFAVLTGLLAKFEPGDLMLLSDIVDALTDIKGDYANSRACVDFIDATVAWIGKGFKGEHSPDFAGRLGRALELLQKWNPALDDTIKAGLEDNLRAYAAENYGDANSPLPEEADKTTNLAPTNAFLRGESIALFITEGRERLSQAQELVLLLENNPEDAESLAALFRVFHTIKGECGFMHFDQLGDLTHRLENLLDLLRGGKLVLSRSLADLLLQGIDRSLTLLKSLAEGHGDKATGPEFASFLEELSRVSAEVQPGLGDLLVQSGKIEERDVEEILTKQRSGHFKERFGEIAVKEELINSSDLRQALVRQSLAAVLPEGLKAEAAGSPQDEIIKVRIEKVNYLVDMIGELTIALGQVAENSAAMAQVRKITRGLQIGAMELRTDTMHGLFSTVKRIVRDLSHSLGKEVNIHTEGEGLEVDRHLIKKLEEPVMHLVRNAIDHGLEKSGSIRVAALRRGSTIEITVEDDGKGLDRDRILAKALERGLVGSQAAGALTDDQVFDFIFQPGFSTRETATHVSGRGVGLDIVKSMVRASRGSISLRTERGRGTAFTMTFPISTAIIDGLVVKVGANTLIVPTSSVVELLKVKDSQLSMVSGDIELITLRDKVMPILRLEHVLGIGMQRKAESLVGLVVENSDHQSHFLVIDEVIAKREVVAKPLGPRFKNLRGIAAGTVLPGGAIGLVLDVDQLINLALEMGNVRPGSGVEESPWK